MEYGHCEGRRKEGSTVPETRRVMGAWIRLESNELEMKWKDKDKCKLGSR